jgi:hypothetical protein
MEREMISPGASRSFSSRTTRAILSCVVALTLLALSAASARADVGVMSVSRGGGAAGDEITVTLGCGFCFPPCKGPKGERHPAGFKRGTCMLGTDGAEPPESFAISLVALDHAPRPHRCGPDALCMPEVSAPPHRGPYRYLGEAVPPARGNNPEGGDIPKYSLDFKIPHLAPGIYTYVIYCDVCLKGRKGSLIADPNGLLWRLRVTAPRATANSINSSES